MAPAMNTLMWEKPSVKRNIAQLKADGIMMIDPDSGYLSCGAIGAGRMAEPDRIFQIIHDKLKKP